MALAGAWRKISDTTAPPVSAATASFETLSNSNEPYGAHTRAEIEKPGSFLLAADLHETGSDAQRTDGVVAMDRARNADCLECLQPDQLAALVTSGDLQRPVGSDR